MPPVADDWNQAIEEAIAANAANDGTDRPSTLGELYRALAAIAPRQKASSWKRTVGKAREGSLPSEATAQAIAQALGVPRETLPAAKPERPSLADVDRRLRSVEELARAVVDSLEVSQAADESSRNSREELLIAIEALRKTIDARIAALESRVDALEA